MYVDFAINENGDLVFEDSNQNYSHLHLKFNISKNNIQKVSFAIRKGERLIHSSDDYLKVSFFLKGNEQNIITKLYKDDDALIQLIKLQLKDNLGELAYRTEDGSLLNSFKHRNINEETLTELENYLTEFLSSYLFNPIVKVTPNINYINGYKQEILIDIYNNEDHLLSYTLES
jgi:hypothetical protein